ncbi:electron transfer flavoprotein subunit beta/FixA family protein [Pelotomaculum propionicicum]|uniref:electron transfer flavoprotein subunit beta/FixA family protein n=1 Tax=Pelotomaculum propionicicum TaxID=258475 RepID=UPI003BA342B7
MVRLKGGTILKVVVLIRNTVDCRVPLPPGPYGEVPLPEGMATIFNPADWQALEQGLGLFDSNDRHQVTAISLGGPEAEESLRWCLAAGAQEALRIWDDDLAGADELGRGRALAAAVLNLKPDLLLCGDGCLDQLNSMLPGVIAAGSGMAYVPGVTILEKVEEGRAQVVRRLGKGRRARMIVKLPAVLALESQGDISPCAAGLPELVAAFTSTVPCLDLAGLGLAAEWCGSRGAKIHSITVKAPVPVTVGLASPDSRLPAEQRIRQILAGAQMRKQGEVVTGTPEELAEKIYQFIRANL